MFCSRSISIEQSNTDRFSSSLTNTLDHNPRSSLMDYLTDWLTGKQRVKKEGNGQNMKETSPPPPVQPDCSLTNSNVESSTLVRSSTLNVQNVNYLHPDLAILTRSIGESDINELIRQPNGVDRNEWIANNIVAFFNHVNALNDAISDQCTNSTCPEMVGPQKSFYYWFDERNKKMKCSAPRYIDLALIFIQKSLADENIFPTRLDQHFPPYFDSIVRKMVRLLYHVVAHLYAAHYHQIVELQLNPHLNSFFLHFVSFLITSKLIHSDNQTVNTNSTGPTAPTGSTDGRDLRNELDSLESLYRTLSDQWRRDHQIFSQRRRPNNE